VAIALLAATVVLAMRERSLAGEGTASVPPLAMATIAPDPTAGPPPAIGQAQNGLIAFVSDRDGNDEIYVMRPDGSEPVRVTDNPGIDTSPAWSADGSQLAWLRIEDGDGNGRFGDSADSWLAIAAQPDGGDPRVVFQGSGGWIESGASSPDFTRLAFYAVVDQNENNEHDDDDLPFLLVTDTARPEADPVDLLEGLPGFTPSPLQANFPILWAPDGTTLYAMLEGQEGQGLYALLLDGGEPQLVIEGTMQQAALSPDGLRLAAWIEYEDTGRRRRRMVVHDLETGLESTLLMGGLGLSSVNNLSWDPQGGRLLFMGSTGVSAPEIYALDVVEDTLNNLTQRVDLPAFLPVWSPDGREVAFWLQEYQRSGQEFVPVGNADIFLADDLGAATTQLTQDQGNNTQPAWQPVY
jgi:Tol biopolymer transport system component